MKLENFNRSGLMTVLSWFLIGSIFGWIGGMSLFHFAIRPFLQRRIERGSQRRQELALQRFKEIFSEIEKDVREEHAKKLSAFKIPGWDEIKIDPKGRV